MKTNKKLTISYSPSLINEFPLKKKKSLINELKWKFSDLKEPKNKKPQNLRVKNVI